MREWEKNIMLYNFINEQQHQTPKLKNIKIINAFIKSTPSIITTKYTTQIYWNNDMLNGFINFEL